MFPEIPGAYKDDPATFQKIAVAETSKINSFFTSLG